MISAPYGLPAETIITHPNPKSAPAGRTSDCRKCVKMSNNEIEFDKVVEYKDTITSSVPVVETVKLTAKVDASKLKQQCHRCHKVRVTHPYSTPLITESNPTGVHWLCRECSKPVRIELRNYDRPGAKLAVVEFFQELEVPQVFQVSTKSPGLQGLNKSWTVEFRKKFHLELTDKPALFAVWV